MSNPSNNTRPSGDISTELSTNQSPNNARLYQPSGDMSTTSTIENEIRRVNGSAVGRDNQAGAFMNDQNYVSSSNTFPELPSSRQIDELHINMVTSKATKAFNKELLTVVNLTEVQKEQCKEVRDRPRACAKMLDFWRANVGENERRTVDCLISLVKEAGRTADVARTTDVAGMVDELIGSRI